MDPVDEEVGKDEKEGKLEEVVERKRGLRWRVVEFSVAADFKEEEGCCEYAHDGHGDHGLFHLEPDLIFEVLGVRKGVVIEDEVIGRRSKDIVDDKAKKPI